MEEIRKKLLQKEDNSSQKDGQTKSKKFANLRFGSNKKKVDEYIETLKAGQAALVEAYEKKLAEQSAALSMALREKEKIAAQNEEMTEKLKGVFIDAKVSELAAENNMLKTKLAALTELEHKNEMLEEKLRDMQARYDHIAAMSKSLQETLTEKEEIILEQCKKFAETEKKLRLEIERIKAEADGSKRFLELKIESAKDSLNKVLYVLSEAEQ